MPHSPRVLPLLALAVASLSPAVGLAQSTAPGLFTFWQDPEQELQLSGSGMFQNQGHVKKTDEDVQLTIYDAAGRYRFTTQYPINPTVGFDYTLLDVESDRPGVPEQLVDTAVGFASPVKKFENDWFLALGASVGYAGPGPFGVADAFYGRGTVIVGKQLGPDSNLLIALDYDGNRAVFPDVPLPGFVYTFNAERRVKLAVGFPFNTITWQPVEPLKIEATVAIPNADATVRITYKLAEPVQLFANYERRTEAFEVEGLPKVDRMFFEQRFAEAGVKWSPARNVGLTVAGGYAFGQEFSTGFDLRDTDLVYKPSDSLYGRVGLEVWPW
ncbi:MAG TPA: hypothetical protein VK324_11740 [Tepidisphaeraceae bacterium]|nr:hypothetical protein [Tepidisphaeraceae bacterium]